MHARLALAIGVAVLAGGAQPASAAVINVNTTVEADQNDGLCSLKEAVTSASADSDQGAGCPPGSGPDTIVVPAGTYTFSLGGVSTGSSVTIDGAGAESTIVDGAATDIPFYVFGTSVRIQDLTVRNGYHYGIHNGGSLTVSSVTVTGNVADPNGGGGIQNTGNGVLTVANSTIDDNVGTGIFNEGTLNVAASSVSDNTDTTGGVGGGIHSTGPNSNATVTGSTVSGNSDSGIFTTGPLTVVDTTVSNNTASAFGGGVSILAGANSTVTSALNRVTITGNDAPNGGGAGIANGTHPTGTSNLTITNSRIAGNDAQSGAGITSFADNGTMTVQQSSITGNDAAGTSGQGFGGGLSVSGGTTTLRNATVGGNTAADNGGAIVIHQGTLRLESSTVAGNSATAFNGGIVNGGTLVLGNTIVADNTGGAGDCNSLNLVQSLGYNLIENLGNCAFEGESTGNIIGADPQLGPLSNHGLTDAMAPDSDGPVIDAGCSFGMTRDQRNQNRPEEFTSKPNVGDGSDIGAFEVGNSEQPLGGTCPPEPPDPGNGSGNGSSGGQGGGGGASTHQLPTAQAFGARTLVSLSLARRSIPAGGPIPVRVTNQNGFSVSGRLSGRTVRRVRGAQRRVTLRARSFTVAARSRKTVRLTVPRALRRRLRRRGRMALRVTAIVRDPAGNRRTVSRRITVRLRKNRRG